MKTSPDTTGEMENGRSISVTNTAFHENSNFAMAQEAARPKIRFIGTLIAEMTRVKRIALKESRVASDVMKYPTPLANAWVKTLMSGSNRNNSAKASPIAMSVHFTNGDSSVPRCEADCLLARLDGAAD